jgi:hypothetical protein
MILAINAPEIAAGKEDIADPFRSADGRLLSPVDANRCDIEPRTRTTVTISTSESVHTTLAGTKRTICKKYLITIFVIVCHHGPKIIQVRQNQ